MSPARAGPQARAGDIEHNAFWVSENRQTMLRAAREIQDDPRTVGSGPQPNGTHVHAMPGGGLPHAGVTRGRTTGSGINGCDDYADAEYQRA
jgi:hypothetical protein